MSDAQLPSLACSGRLIVVVGPSGAGKDSLMRGWRATLDPSVVHFARRVITRDPDASEDHESVTRAGFDTLRSAGLLGTWWQAHELAYGVRLSEFEGLAHGRWVVVNGSRAHLPALRMQAPHLHVIEITAAAEVLEARLAARSREDERARAARLNRRIETPVDASLRLVNDGTLQRGVEALQRWWRDVALGRPT